MASIEGAASFQDSQPAGHQLPERIAQIDLLKALAILSVIIMHTLTVQTLLAIGSPYHIWQAVPLFLMIAGITGAYGYRKRNAVSLKECYDPKLLLRRYSRLLIPFLLLYILELIILPTSLQIPPGPLPFIISFFLGGVGYGAFFVPVILQSVLIVPLLYLMALRNPEQMVGVALCLNILFVAWVVLSGNTGISSFIYLQYLFAGALGVWLVTSTKRPGTIIGIGAAASFMFITLASYTSLFPPTSIFYQYGGILQFPTIGWTLVLAMAGLKYLPVIPAHWFDRSLAGIGKASWHIYLVQMLYFLFPSKYVVLSLAKVSPGFYRGIMLPLFGGFSPVLMLTEGVVVNILICVICGYAWYYSENRLLGRISAKNHPD